MTTYKVHTAKGWIYFELLADAKAFCETVWLRTGVILTIVAEEI